MQMNFRICPRKISPEHASIYLTKKLFSPELISTEELSTKVRPTNQGIRQKWKGMLLNIRATFRKKGSRTIARLDFSRKIFPTRSKNKGSIDCPPICGLEPGFELKCLLLQRNWRTESTNKNFPWLETKAFLKEFAVKKLWTKYISKNIKLSNVTKHCLEQNHCKKREAFFAYYLFFSHKYMQISPLLQLRTWRRHF